MHTTLLIVHSLFRWLVLAMLVASLFRAAIGYYNNKSFSPIDNALRHWTATTGHIQLMIGVLLYIQSPVTRFFWHFEQNDFAPAFFAVVHAGLMTLAVIMLTIGSALAKRRTTHPEKFKTMLLWFALALLTILIAIPWPFSPLAGRPYFRF